MKTFYKILISISLVSLVLILISFQNTPLAVLGEYLFGTYQTYLGALLTAFGIPLVIGVITFIWKEF